MREIAIDEHLLNVEIMLENRKTAVARMINGKIILKAPLHAEPQQLLNWLAGKQKWIQKQLDREELHKINDDEIWILGTKKYVRVIHTKDTVGCHERRFFIDRNRQRKPKQFACDGKISAL